MEVHVLVGSLILIFSTQVVEPQACGNPVYNSRIVGGTDAVPGSWPWQISFQKQGRHICGGSLLTESWVVTAAHCLEGVKNPNPTLYTILLGGYQLSVTNKNQTILPVKEIIVHENYDDLTHDNDIALVLLNQNVAYSDYILPICLPSSTVQFPDGLLCWVTGWGYVNEGVSLQGSKTLQEVQVPLINQPTCDCLYHINTDNSQSTQMVANSSICAGYINGQKDSCQGDSGGPLVCKDTSNIWILAGIVSWGTGCAEALIPGVYSRVTTFQSWLQGHIPELQFLALNQTEWPKAELMTVKYMCGYSNGIAGLSTGNILSSSTAALQFCMVFIVILQQIRGLPEL